MPGMTETACLTPAKAPFREHQLLIAAGSLLKAEASGELPQKLGELPQLPGLPILLRLGTSQHRRF
jgi:hypothetical protein